jgi:GH15 family glucan-1,4-alpha-glucosidase
MAQLYSNPDDTDLPTWFLIKQMADYTMSALGSPDNGLFEFRGAVRPFTSGQAMMVAGLQAAARIAGARGKRRLEREWFKAASEFWDLFLRRVTNDRGVILMAPERETLDASVLLAVIYGVMDSRDGRVKPTLEAIEEELGHHGLIRRYKPEQAGDGLPAEEEGAFLLCGAWVGIVHARRGEIEPARQHYDALMACRTELGTYTEEAMYIKEVLHHLGNFGQAFSIVGAIMLELAIHEATR